MAKADISALKEPSGLLRTDGKRPDGVTLLPWKEGNVRDVTMSDTLAQSYVHEPPGGGQKEKSKYSSLTQSYLFVSVAAETMGTINKDEMDFLSDIGRRITQSIGLHTITTRAPSCFDQRLSILIQRCNAVAVFDTFTKTISKDEL